MAPARQCGAFLDPTKPPGLGQQAPLTPEYQAIFEATLKDRASAGSRRPDQPVPAARPAADDGAIFPVEFVVTYRSHLLHDRLHDVAPHLHRRPRLAKDLLPSFNGYSIANGSTPTATAATTCSKSSPAASKSPRTFEGSGLPLHRDGESVITERIFLDKADENLLHDEVTVIDHA